MDATVPVDVLDFSVNALTKIPSGLGKFTQLVDLRMNNNSIAAISSGDLNELKANVMNLDFSNNLIATIENGSLPRNNK